MCAENTRTEMCTNCNKVTKHITPSIYLYILYIYIIIYTQGKNLHLYRTNNQCGDTIEKFQAPYDGCINVRNMLSIEEMKQNLINFDIYLVSYFSTITMMHGPIYIRKKSKQLKNKRST